MRRRRGGKRQKQLTCLPSSDPLFLADSGRRHTCAKENQAAIVSEKSGAKNIKAEGENEAGIF